ncbi:MAG: hypothetical protein K0B10_05645 [Vicingaceae bacterium]|nr:hypothetical protein [Vicingaceae bacterium]
MLKTLLYNQLRQGLFLIPLIIIPLNFFTPNYLIVFLLFQNRFFNVLQQNDFHLPLLHITGAGLNNLLKAYNLSWAIWFNGWFIVAQIINLIGVKISLQELMINAINFNSLLFLSFIVGNTLSNSDMITIKNGLLRLIGASFFFGTSISLCFALLKGVEMLHITFLVNVVFLLSMLSVWHYHVNLQKRVTYIPYYL